MSAQDIAAVVQEIAPALRGGWIQKISQPAPRALTLDIRTAGRTLSLYLSVNPEAARLHLLSHRYPNPPTPPPFCQFLRAHIQGARIGRLEQVQQDRIVRLQLMARNGPCFLIAELTGRGATLLLTDADNKVLTALDGAGEKTGGAYHTPARPEPAGEGPASEGRAFLLDHSPAPGVVSPAISPARPRTRRDAPFSPSPELAKTSSSPRGRAPSQDHQPPRVPHADFPISAAFERQYYEREADLTIAHLRQAKISDLKKRLKKATRRVAALQGDLDKAFRYRDYARYGDLLKANLHQMQKGQEQLTVIDYFDTALPELVIPLDPAKSPHGNMEDYFKKYRKYIASEREIRPRLEADEQRLTTLRAELAEVECGIWQPALSQAAVVMPFTRSQEKSVAAKNAVSRSGPFRRFLSADGLPIYVGRNARENEALTFGEARPDDLWLHAHGTPGSHVVVRLEKGADPPPETIRDAATLALLYSDLKKNGKGEVIYTRKKYVRKVKAKSPGTVTVTQEKTTFVTLDRARLDRLKERSR